MSFGSPFDMDRALAITDRLSRLAETAAVVLIFAYCGLMLFEVLARSQAQSLSFTWEYSQYAMAAVFALGSGPAVRHAVHVRITLLAEFLPARVGKWLDVLATLVALAIVALIVTALWNRAYTSYARDILAITVSKTPLWVPQAFVLWGFVQLWLDLATRLVRRVSGRDHEWRNADAEPSDV